MENYCIKVMAEYACYPLWHADGPDCGAVYDIPLGITKELKDRIDNWQIKYDSTLNQDYPPESSFKSQKEEIEFEKEGLFIWKELKKQLGPKYKITYYSEEKQTIFEDESDYDFEELEKHYLSC